MDSIEAILTRRSIRQYTAQKISDDKIKRILQAAMYAPSAFNKQPWQFIVLEKKEIIEGLIKVIPYGDMFKQAPLAIIFCGDTQLEENIDFIVQDLSAAIQNSLLAAHACSLGAVWIGIYPDKGIIEGIKKHFNLPDNIIPISAITVGFPAEICSAEERFVESKIHINRW